ncbi:hypothetical protein AGLY_007415 [Aphis glycines]|uniref:THAP-type domain-containing protein n=1 Tax=Aphis glycines TaxID=307491 RepID=A0A6G0TQV3_APHGL|nr:hypothetical protein AGLY_007415 [Aphis glycines]
MLAEHTCKWHVDNNWRKNLKIVGPQTVKAYIYKTLHVLLEEEPDVTWFEKLNFFLEKLEEEPTLHNFKAYFLSYYVHRKLHNYRFPLKRTDVIQKWIKEVRRKNFVPSKYTFLCCKHFLDSDYQIRPGATTKLLNENAIPSVFKGFPVHLQKSLPVKRRILQRNIPDIVNTYLSFVNTWPQFERIYFVDKSPRIQISHLNLTKLQLLKILILERKQLAYLRK